MISDQFPHHWQILPLEEAVDALIDYRGKTPKKTNSGIPLITAKIVKGGAILPATEFIAEEDYDSWMIRGFPQIGDVVVTTEAPLGEVAQLSDSNVALAQRIVTLRGVKGLLFNDYLRYVMQGSYVQRQLESRATGSTVSGIKQSELRKVLLPIPSLQEQIFIASHLKSLDDKIQLSQQINQTLEQMAQAIFKSWFVDFEPVKAKIAALEAGGSAEDALLAAMQAISGKNEAQLNQLQKEQTEQYAELRATAELFPSAMQESALGEIPEGWQATNFGEVSICLDKHRIPLSKAQRDKKKGNIPYYGATSIMDYVDEHLFDGIYLLLGEDGSVLREDGTPFTQYIWGRVWVNNHAHVLRGANGVSTEQLMLFMKNQNLAPYVTGAVQLKLNQKNMNSIPFIKAADRVCDAFNRLLVPMFAELRNRHDESLALGRTRDALLPKLLSGAIRSN